MSEIIDLDNLKDYLIMRLAIELALFDDRNIVLGSDFVEANKEITMNWDL